MKVLNKQGFTFSKHTILLLVWMGFTIRAEAKLLGPALNMSVSVNDTLDGEIFTAVEQMPEFPGGMSALNRYLAKNIRHPKECANPVGRVTVSFVITKTGKVKDADVKARNCDASQWKQEMIAVIKSMPVWKPGKHQGKPVNVRYSMPIRFPFSQ